MAIINSDPNKVQVDWTNIKSSPVPSINGEPITGTPHIKINNNVLEFIKFKSFFTEYFLNFIDDNKEKYKVSKNCIKKKIYESKFVEHRYNSIENFLKSSNKNFIIMVEDFLDFLQFSEKYLLFKNSESNKIYFVNSTENKKELYFNYNEFTMKFEFELTKIKNPASSNIALSMISNDKHVKFINIEVLSNYNKSSKINSFKFISDENIVFENPDDAILFNIIKVQLSNEIMKLFDDILIHSIGIYTGLNVENLVWRDFLNYGLRIRKH